MRMTAKHGGAFTLALAAGLLSAQSAYATPTAALSSDPVTLGLQEDVQNIVFIYAENRSFDSLFGHFTGANGLVDGMGNPKTFLPQLDRNSTTLPNLPPVWGGVTAPGNADAAGTTFRTVTQSQSAGLANAPFPVEPAFTATSGLTLTTFDTTRDLFHRFFENQMQINGGSNDMFTAWADSGGLVMGHWDYSHSRLYGLAQQYALADNFYQSAFGGSFLNHQFLICACAPTVPAGTVTGNGMSINVLGTPNGKGVVQLATNSSSPASALSGPPSFKTGNIAPLDYFGMGDGYRAVNTMQPAFQPSGNAPVDASGNDLLYADPSKANTLPAQTQTTIGDLLDGVGVNWAWYSGAWTAATTDGEQLGSVPRTVIYTQGKVTNVPNPNDSSGQSATLASVNKPRGTPNFQAHHHPFNYYAAFDPVSNAAHRGAHLKDYTDLLNDAQNGTLPPVAFYKPTGNVNQHAGYTNADDGDNHIADLVATLQASPQWPHMVIVITWDENGGVWDHAAPPQGDLLGPGSRIPALIISPYAKKGFVDDTQYDTASITRLIIRKYSLTPLAGLTARDTALTNNGFPVMGDLTNALSLPIPVPQASTLKFTDRGGAKSAVKVASGAAAVKGIGAATTISISGDPSAQYSVNGGAFTNAAGTVNNGDTVRLQLTSGALLNNVVSASLNVGGRSAGWNVTTGTDTTPNPLRFTALGNQTKGAPVQSNTLTVSGISVPVAVSVGGDASTQYSLNGGGFTSAAGMLNPGDTLTLQVTASSTPKTVVLSTVTVGTASFKWSVDSGN